MTWYGNWAAVIASILFFTIFLLSSILGITIQPTGETGHLVEVALDRLGILELDKGVFLVMAVRNCNAH